MILCGTISACEKSDASEQGSIFGTFSTVSLVVNFVYTGADSVIIEQETGRAHAVSSCYQRVLDAGRPISKAEEEML